MCYAKNYSNPYLLALGSVVYIHGYFLMREIKVHYCYKDKVDLVLLNCWTIPSEYDVINDLQANFLWTNSCSIFVE